MKSITIAKFEERACSEDASLANNLRIAVSDGAGGCGILANRWSAYLLSNLSIQPLNNYSHFSNWIDSIWEQFYQENKSLVASIGGFGQNRFYDEGSYATLATAWIGEVKVKWIAYGDSVVFHYNDLTHELDHSFTNLADFSKSPWLINWKEEVKPEGFRSGEFRVNSHSVVFIASDALAFYLLASYQILHNSVDGESQIADVMNGFSQQKTILANLHQSYNSLDRFSETVLEPLLRAAQNECDFKSHLKLLCSKGLIAFDDYSLAWNDFRRKVDMCKISKRTIYGVKVKVVERKCGFYKFKRLMRAN